MGGMTPLEPAQTRSLFSDVGVPWTYRCAIRPKFHRCRDTPSAGMPWENSSLEQRFEPEALAGRWYSASHSVRRPSTGFVVLKGR
jgi:hypothetical protein